MAQSILLYGESSTFKTSQIGLFADYEFNRTGRVTHLVTCDSGFGSVADQVERGTIVPLCLESAPFPVPVLSKLSKGLWPCIAINAREGLWDLSLGSSFAPCEAGAYAVEGLTRICELVRKSWCEEQREMGEPLQGKYTQMEERFAFQSRGTLFGTQQLINNLVINFRGLPVDRVLFTAHESKGRDVSGKTVFGPATTGLALTDKVGGWFELTLHHESYQYAIKRGARSVSRSGVRAYFMRHQDAEVKGMYWPAKISLPAYITARILEVYDEGWFPLAMEGEEYISGLHTFLYLIDNGGSFATPGVECIMDERAAIAAAPSVPSVPSETDSGEPAKTVIPPSPVIITPNDFDDDADCGDDDEGDEDEEDKEDA